MLSDASKHLYDIVAISNHPRIQKSLNDKSKIHQLVAIKRKEETSLGRELGKLPIASFAIFKDPQKDKELKQAFQDMQEIYVFDKNDLIPFDDMVIKVKHVQQIFATLDSHCKKFGRL